MTPYEAPLAIENEHPNLQLDIEKIKTLVHLVLDGEGFTLTYLGIVLSDHEAIHAMNREHLGHDYETDVLSFPLQSDHHIRTYKQVEGEIYVDLDTALEVAPEYHTVFEQEALRYIVHGLLHLMGYDDATDAQRKQMSMSEDRYLKAM
ncbi:MAG TPA: rRNA maturation RNase YbeY [Rhodothermales bacterium]|nr:rRNA maturation RNase YbeY [Bacteroidota bacterium]HRK73142.1 rRNA maturation RNase YbeY [Rhodothermales bacterium]HRR10224.1 rRNA maturation RNase YbeY [Rhodothermales bacterium]